MGGMVAQLMVLERAERIGSLVLMDTHHGVLSDLDRDLIALGQEVARRDGLEVIQHILKMGRTRWPTRHTSGCATNVPAIASGPRPRCWPVSPAMYASMLGELAGVPDRLDRLAAVEVPTLAVVGEHDAAFVDATRGHGSDHPRCAPCGGAGRGAQPPIRGAGGLAGTAVRGFFDEVVGLSDAAAVTSP